MRKDRRVWHIFQPFEKNNLFHQDKVAKPRKKFLSKGSNYSKPRRVRHIFQQFEKNNFVCLSIWQDPIRKLSLIQNLLIRKPKIACLAAEREERRGRGKKRKKEERTNLNMKGTLETRSEETSKGADQRCEHGHNKHVSEEWRHVHCTPRDEKL